uniref:Uncharacterized protein n=1 Tax=Geospiza parvula TaxID=87175 RepID=A0A8U8BCI6_GEOPR
LLLPSSAPQHPQTHHGWPTATPPRLPRARASLACQHLWTHEDTFPGDALRLLQDVASSPSSPPPCSTTTCSRAQAAATALRILQHLFHTLSSNSTRQHWPSQARNHLLNKLQHHIHHLEQCLPDNATPFKGPRNPLLAINKYFRDIHLFLHAHNHSACAWDHVRLEARASLQHLHNLTRTMRR